VANPQVFLKLKPNYNFLTFISFNRCGCNVNAKSSWSEKTALSVAAFAGEVDVFEMLINHGASGYLSFQVTLLTYYNNTFVNVDVFEILFSHALSFLLLLVTITFPNLYVFEMLIQETNA
jgi:hypothetical protein